MCAANAAKNRDPVSEVALKILWAQWGAFGGMTASTQELRSLVDPEALVLGSLAFRAYERRLWDLTADWALSGASLLSVQRMKNLVPEYPQPVKDQLGEFGQLAYSRARDHRWKSLLLPEQTFVGQLPRGNKARSLGPNLMKASSLVLRLRNGFGVGTKGDIISILLTAGRMVTDRFITDVTRYKRATIQRALGDLVMAGFISSSREQPAVYSTDTAAWCRLLGLPEEELPVLIDWNSIFAYAAHLQALFEKLNRGEVSSYARGVAIRNLLERYQAAFIRSGAVELDKDLRLPAGSGELDSTNTFLARWIVNNA